MLFSHISSTMIHELAQQISHSPYGNNRRYAICILAADEKNRKRERQGKSVEGRGEYFARQEIALLLDN